MPKQNTTTGPDSKPGHDLDHIFDGLDQYQLLAALQRIAGLAASEPCTTNEANETLYAIEDVAKAALFNR